MQIKNLDKMTTAEADALMPYAVGRYLRIKSGAVACTVEEARDLAAVIKACAAKRTKKGAAA